METAETLNSISALKQGVVIEPKLRNDAQGEGGFMRRGSDIGDRFSEGGDPYIRSGGNIKGTQAGSYEGTETT